MKSCRITRAGRNGSSTSSGAGAFQAARRFTSSALTSSPSTLLQHGLEQHLDRERQPREVPRDAGLFERVEPVDRGAAEAGVERRAGAEYVGLHEDPRLAVGRAGRECSRAADGKLIPGGDRRRPRGSRDRRSAGGARPPSGCRRAARPRRAAGRGPARSDNGAPRSKRDRPESRVSSSSARHSRPGPRRSSGPRPLARKGSAARISTQPGVPGASTERFRQWCIP